MSMPVVRLRKGRARTLWGRHPWVFEGSVAAVDGAPEDGDVVDVVDEQGRFVARGFWNGGSFLRVRAVTWDAAEAVDDALLDRRVREAIAVRRDVVALPDESTDAYRLVHSEGDRLPGLVADLYGEWIVVRIGSRGMERRREAIARSLLDATGARGVWLSPDDAFREREGLVITEPGVLAGETPPDEVSIREAGIAYQVDLRGGQKTGHYLDQRENRIRVAELAGGRRVLDAFCSTGGFALAADVLGGAASVRAIESSADALARARRNAAANGAQRIEWVEADVFAELRRMEREDAARFDLVILDPPRFAKNERELEAAFRGYKDVNLRALRLLEPGGVLVSCSCSSPVTFEHHEVMLREAAMDVGRDLRVIEWRGAGGDHPVLVSAPEGRYLTVVVGVVS